jgi:hypothetical protein
MAKLWKSRSLLTEEVQHAIARKLFRLFSVASIVVLVSGLLTAASAPPPNVIGQVEATMTFCGQADPPSADKYKEFAKKLTRDMSEKELADARNSKDYKDIYDAITTELQKASPDEAREGCRAILKSDKK